MDEKNIPVIPFKREKEKWHMWSGKFMATTVIKGYYFLLTSSKKIPEDDKYIT